MSFVAKNSGHRFKGEPTALAALAAGFGGHRNALYRKLQHESLRWEFGPWEAVC